MDNRNGEQDNRNLEEAADYYMRGGKRRLNMPISVSDSSDSESESEGNSSRLPNKRDKKSRRHRYTEHFRDPGNNIALSHYCEPLVPRLTISNFDPNQPSTSKAAFAFDQNGNQPDLGERNTTANNATVQCATPDNVQNVDAIQDIIIHPDVRRFTELKINDELCHLGRRGDILMITENFMTCLNNQLLRVKNILSKNVCDFVRWAKKVETDHTEEKNFNVTSLMSQILALFGPNSDQYKELNEALQEVGVHRTKCIQIRRDSVITDIPDEQLRSLLAKVPPGEGYLFDQIELQRLIDASGGKNSWLKTPENVNEGNAVNERASERDPRPAQEGQGTNRPEKNKLHRRTRQKSSQLSNSK